jgi:hypothetical protein
MDNLEEVQKTVSHNTFFQHVFEFDESTKNELLNIGQYSALVLVPVVMFNKLMKHYIPEADESKGSLELTLEIFGQVILLFIGLFYIHRVATFLPTYSGQKYEQFNIHSIILVALLIVSSLHTKLGEKTSILTERLMAIWNGEEPITAPQKGNQKSKQPPQQAMQGNVHMQMPPNPVVQPPMSAQQQMAINMGVPEQQFQMNPQQPQQMQEFMQPEIMAANEGIGSAFGSMF